ncbi:tRNA-intron endonuclease catalytic domain-like protein [Violaceomyces palustris]|uniref:tRNA-intron endonuclease catalytic domain-like protein n=1 Tax=Violaceomyces palustris TaxID=1673888 RepID=A0ACD0P186_9BASI|nr:tRNA-intron endonuclease catalytic domain-like protein [Violaceomyces palustris]
MDGFRSKHAGKVPIHIINKHAYIWETQDVAFVRTEHHICGLMTGTLPMLNQQNIFLGLPLQLFPEEVVLLMRKGVAVLIDDVNAHKPATMSEKEAYEKAYKEDADQQRRTTLSLRKKTMAAYVSRNQSSSSSSAANDKRAKREEAKREAELERRRQHESEVDHQLPDPEDLKAMNERRKEEKGEEEEEEEQLSKLPYLHLTHGSSSSLPWYHPDSSSTAYTTLSSAAEAGLWTYPSNQSERASCAVFEDLHRRGYYMGIGLRFGGHFSVYPGDPLRYHAHYSATVYTTPGQPVNALELVASGRLGTAVKKSHLICSVRLREPTRPEEEDGSGRSRYDHSDDAAWGEVEYFSLSWAGFGT